jgi:hypothetical protein
MSPHARRGQITSKAFDVAVHAQDKYTASAIRAPTNKAAANAKCIHLRHQKGSHSEDIEAHLKHAGQHPDMTRHQRGCNTSPQPRCVRISNSESMRLQGTTFERVPTASWPNEPSIDNQQTPVQELKELDEPQAIDESVPCSEHRQRNVNGQWRGRWQTHCRERPARTASANPISGSTAEAHDDGVPRNERKKSHIVNRESNHKSDVTDIYPLHVALPKRGRRLINCRTN